MQLRGGSSRSSPFNGSVIAIICAGLIVRLCLWSYFRDAPIHIWDEGEFDTLATNLVDYGEFTYHPRSTPASLRPPLYPAFVAGMYSVFGVGNYAAVRLVQLLVSLLTVGVAYRLARDVAGSRIATLAAAILCFYPSLLVFNNLLLTEVLFTFLLTTTCYLLVLGMRKRSAAVVATAGCVLGLAALTRSVVWLAPPFVGIFLALAWEGPWKKRCQPAAGFILAFALTIAPWVIRNTRLQQTFVAIDVMGGRNFMMGNYQHTPLFRSWDAISLEGDKSWAHEVWTTFPPDERRTQGLVDKLAFRLGVEYVVAHPWQTLGRSVVKFFDFWGLEREITAGAGRGFFGDSSKWGLLLLSVIVAGTYAAAILLSIFGFVLTPLGDRRGHWLFLCVIAFVCGVHSIVFGHSRYHLPLMPLILIYTAAAIANLGYIWRQRRTPRFALATTCCMFLISGWIVSFIATDWERLTAALSTAN